MDPASPFRSRSCNVLAASRKTCLRQSKRYSLPFRLRQLSGRSRHVLVNNTTTYPASPPVKVAVILHPTTERQTWVPPIPQTPKRDVSSSAPQIVHAAALLLRSIRRRIQTTTLAHVSSSTRPVLQAVHVNAPIQPTCY